MYSMENHVKMPFGAFLLNCACKVAEAAKLKKRPKVKVDTVVEDTRLDKRTSFYSRKSRISVVYHFNETNIRLIKIFR
jgi:hypothetical protein